MLLSFSQLKKKEKILSVTVFIVAFFIAVLSARRSLIWTFSWAFILSYYIHFFSHKKSSKQKIKLIIILLFISASIFFVYTKYEELIFGNLLSRINSDSRSTILHDFYNDMSTGDFIFGKGIDGSYLLHETDTYNFGSNRRNIIEAGYLNIILKGGYIYLILLFFIYLKVFIRGFFQSKNKYAKIFAAFIFIHIMEAYPAGVLTFNIRFFLIWFCIAMLWNKKFIKMTDSEVELISNNRLNG